MYFHDAILDDADVIPKWYIEVIEKTTQVIYATQLPRSLYSIILTQMDMHLCTAVFDGHEGSRIIEKSMSLSKHACIDTSKYVRSLLTDPL